MLTVPTIVFGPFTPATVSCLTEPPAPDDQDVLVTMPPEARAALAAFVGSTPRVS